ncbi:MAG: hypothetical protein WC831_06420 [Parcubacteria group bacterium]
MNKIRRIEKREEENKDVWYMYNRHLLSGNESYQETFEDLIPNKYENIRKYIEDVLKDKKGSALGLDIGGIGSTVFEEFSSNFFSQTAGVCLKDTRRKHNIDVSLDEQRHHAVIEGDIANKKTRQKIFEWTGGQKIDLVFERMGGGLELLTNDQRWVFSAIQEIYNSTSEIGIIFLQLTYSVAGITEYALIKSRKIEEWANKMKELFPSALDVAWSESDGDCFGVVIRIRKLPGAPEKLPDFRRL